MYDTTIELSTAEIRSSDKRFSFQRYYDSIPPLTRLELGKITFDVEKTDNISERWPKPDNSIDYDNLPRDRGPTREELEMMTKRLKLSERTESR
eukprot:UN23889